jgi:hypothetical protein
VGRSTAPGGYAAAAGPADVHPRPGYSAAPAAAAAGADVSWRAPNLRERLAGGPPAGEGHRAGRARIRYVSSRDEGGYAPEPTGGYGAAGEYSTGGSSAGRGGYAARGGGYADGGGYRGAGEYSAGGESGTGQSPRGLGDGARSGVGDHSETLPTEEPMTPRGAATAERGGGMIPPMAGGAGAGGGQDREHRTKSYLVSRENGEEIFRGAPEAPSGFIDFEQSRQEEPLAEWPTIGEGAPG